MSKKGASHVDWIVSIGIFIVYVLILLVWLKPGYQPVFEEDIFIQTVKNGIEKDNSVKVFKTLLHLECGNSGVHTFNLDDYVPNLGSAKVIRVGDPPDEIAHTGALTVEAENTMNRYWVISSDDFGYSDFGSLENLEDAGCTENIVESIPIVGIDDIELPRLDPNGDDDPNGKGWGFPESREFKIRVSDFGANDFYRCKDLDLDSEACENVNPDGGVPVFSGDWRTNDVEADGSSSPVLITILVW